MPSTKNISVFKDFGKYTIGATLWCMGKKYRVVDHNFFCKNEWCLGLICEEVKNA